MYKKINTIFNDDKKNIGFRLIKFNGSAGMIRCNNLEKDNFIKILNAMEKINKNNVKIKTIATSGTIRSLLNKHMFKYLT